MKEKETTYCVCGSEMKRDVSSFTHFIFKKEITLHDVPHSYCVACGQSRYDNEDTVVRLLREAYLKQDEQAYYQ